MTFRSFLCHSNYNLLTSLLYSFKRHNRHMTFCKFDIVLCVFVCTTDTQCVLFDVDTLKGTDKKLYRPVSIWIHEGGTFDEKIFPSSRAVLGKIFSYKCVPFHVFKFSFLFNVVWGPREICRDRDSFYLYRLYVLIQNVELAWIAPVTKRRKHVWIHVVTLFVLYSIDIRANVAVVLLPHLFLTIAQDSK